MITHASAADALGDGQPTTTIASVDWTARLGLDECG
jgi:hypothetical protein